jgi:tol-pal system protein YbgF
MKSFCAFCTLAVFAPAMFGASKEMIELQRDVYQLQEQLRTLQSSLDQKLATLQTMVQQSSEQAARTNTAVEVLRSNIGDTLKQQQSSVVGPVQNVGSKLEQMAEDFRAVRESVLDMNNRLSKLDAKVTDLQTSLTVIKNPPPAPGGGASSGMPLTTPGFVPSATSAPPAGVQADSTYTNAFRDYMSGNYDIASQEFNDYLKYFSTTGLAPNAQYYVGDIFFRKKDYENAIVAFDAVLEHYSENSKTPDAHLMKGRSLLALGKRDAAAREFREVVSRYGNSEAAPKAKSLLRDLGLSAPGSAAAAPAKARARRR